MRVPHPWRIDVRARLRAALPMAVPPEGCLERTVPTSRRGARGPRGNQPLVTQMSQLLTQRAKSETRTLLSRARRPMSITARHPADLAIAQAARGWPCPSLLHRRRTRQPHARAINHLVQVSRRWRRARWMVRAPQLVCEAQRVCQTNTRTQYMSLSARIAFKP